MGGCKRCVTKVYMYAALFRLYSSIITQTARRRESVPNGGGGGLAPKFVYQQRTDQISRMANFVLRTMVTLVCVWGGGAPSMVVRCFNTSMGGGGGGQQCIRRGGVGGLKGGEIWLLPGSPYGPRQRPAENFEA